MTRRRYLNKGVRNVANEMTTVNQDAGLLPSFSREKIDLIKRQVARGATDDELQLFLYQAQKKGLDPLSRQIYFQKRRNKSGGEDMTIITAIDGYRAIAHRTGECAGIDDAVYDDEQNPGSARVTVYRIVKGIRCPFSATARWDQYYPGDALGFMWRKMPHLMLGKCAEALALRKAFPEELSGVYVQEEMDQAGPVIEAAPPVNSAPPTLPRLGSTGYDPKQHAKKLHGILESMGIPQSSWEAISNAMIGKSNEQIPVVVKKVREDEQKKATGTSYEAVEGDAYEP